MEEGIKVLFVDDEQNVLSAIKRAFIDENYIILAASSGADGLALFDLHQIQVVVSDYRMPGMNGIEFLREVNKRWPQTVKIVLSGYADIETVVAAVNEGQIYKFIPKPWNDDDLKLTISNALDKYFLQKKNEELTVELQKKNTELTKLNEELNILLEEKFANLEFRTEIVTTYQNILDSVPIGIIGVDLNNDTLAICNSTWANIIGNTRCLLGENIEKSLPGSIVDIIETVKIDHRTKKRLIINGARGVIAATLMEQGNGQRGVILSFTREDDL